MHGKDEISFQFFPTVANKSWYFSCFQPKDNFLCKVSTKFLEHGIMSKQI